MSVAPTGSRRSAGTASACQGHHGQPWWIIHQTKGYNCAAGIEQRTITLTRPLTLGRTCSALCAGDDAHAPQVLSTIGPSCHDVDTLNELLHAGMAAARIDLTWGPLEFHRKSLNNLNEAMRQTRKMCATIVDTLGREIMIRRSLQVDANGWPTPSEKPIPVKEGQTV